MFNFKSTQIHLWIADLDYFDFFEVQSESAAWLSGNEIGRLNHYRSSTRRKQFLLGRVLLRVVLSKYAEVAPETWKFQTNAHGKLFLDPSHGLPIFFNLSHADNRVIIAVSSIRDLGIDIESMHKKRAFLKIANRYFAPDEIKSLNNLSTPLQASRFFELWTLKESVLKACGSGLSGNLARARFTFPSEDKLSLDFDSSKNDLANWQIWQIEISKPYFLALSAKSAGIKITEIESQKFLSLEQTVSEKTQILRSN